MEGESIEESATSGIPRGGPIYLQNMVGQLSTVPEFQSSFLSLLQDLDTHLSLESPRQYDVSTESLKIYTEEELTDMAMKEAFKEDDNLSQNEPEQQSLDVFLPDDQPDGNGRKTKRRRTVKKLVKKPAKKTEEDDNLSQNEPDQSLDAFLPEDQPDGNGRRRTVKKPVKKPAKKTEDAYLAKVEQLAKLKQKQEEDKADVRLHCFSKTCENGKDVSTSPEGFEKLQSLKSTDNYTLVKPSDIQGPVDTLYPEVILCVEIYDSRKSKTQEFLVLGRNLLTELKDKIHCLTDQVMIKAGKYDPSGYFLVEDIFHNDLRDPSATDYSRPILDWLWNSRDEALKKWECILTGEVQKKQKAVLGEAKTMDLPRFGSADMQTTRFCDLTFRLGASYLYCHQGDCKHMIVIRDMRLSHPEDVQNKTVYPRLTFQSKPRIRKCSVCNIYRASKIAVDDKCAQENPCYFCDTCFALLHSEGGSLTCYFPVYEYIYDLHRNPLLLTL